MRRHTLLLAIVLAASLAGCDRESASPTPSSAPAETTASPTETAEPIPTVQGTLSASVSCTADPFDFSSAMPDIPGVTEGDHIYGSLDAPIVVIEYADFQCPGCAAERGLRTYLESTYGVGNILFVYRHFPLSFHPLASIAAEATEAAAAQGKFWEMHDLIYARRSEWAGLSPDQMRDRLVEYAGELGLDARRFAQELDNHTYLQRVNADLQVAERENLPGTPSYIINGVLYPTEVLSLDPTAISGFIRLLLIDQYDSTPPKVIDPQRDYVATIRTTKGDIVVELFAEQAPVNVNNFVFLAWNGWYDGQTFFYVDSDAAYAGDPSGLGLSLSFPGYYCGDEINADLTFDQAGMVAFYAPSPGRNSSLFFITLTPQTDLDGRATIIGRVIEGMEVVQALTQTMPGSGRPAPDAIEMILIEEQ